MKQIRRMVHILWFTLIPLLTGWLMMTGVQSGTVIAQTPVDDDRSTYKNPFNLPNEWVNYGIGDPFILRWNGRFYMYPSTNTHYGGSVGIRVWQSIDLVNWEYAGYATDHPVTYNAYAPEVIYTNGKFYMATSPNGQGHYILESDDPLGPFHPITDNIGHSIDGSFFIDDDDTMYFTRSGHGGIRGHVMPDPVTIGPEHLLNSDLGGWTEGSYILKRNGYYYLTYTGNHLLSTAYRVQYSVSDESPLGPYTIPPDPILVLSTKDEFSGLGHSATVMGPDLDSYWVTYHSMPVRVGPHVRKMNIDRLVFNGRKMDVLGPTHYNNESPKLADYFAWLDEDDAGWTSYPSVGPEGHQFLISPDPTGALFTAEFNVIPAVREIGTVAERLKGPDLDSLGSGSLVGAFFSYENVANYAYVAVDLLRKELSLVTVVGGDHEAIEQVALRNDTDMSLLHTIRVEQTHSRIKVYWDNMLKIEVEAPGRSGGHIGYMWRGTDPLFRFTAWTNDAGGSSDFRVSKPLPGTIEAVHYAARDGVRLRDGDDPLHITRYDDMQGLMLTADNRYAVTFDFRGDARTYNVNVHEAGVYGVGAMAMWEHGDEAVFLMLVDGEEVGHMTLQRPPGTELHEWIKIPAGMVRLPHGFHELSLVLQEGRVNVAHMEFFLATDEPYFVSDALTNGLTGDWRVFGSHGWQAAPDGVHITGGRSTMAVIGDESWTDYSVEVNVATDGRLTSGHGGVLVRARDASYFDSQTVDSVIGYGVQFDGSRVLLRRHEYNLVLLDQARVETRGLQSDQLRVDVSGPTIRVYWNDDPQPVIEYTDENAFLYGAVGLRATAPSVRLSQFKVTCTSCPVYGSITIDGGKYWLLPNQDELEIVLPFAAMEVPPVELDLNDKIAKAWLTLPASLPGNGTIELYDSDENSVHTLNLTFSKITTPRVATDLGGASLSDGGWLESVSGTVPIVVVVNGPESLIKRSLVVLRSIVRGQVEAEHVLFHGEGLPKDLVLNTIDHADGTYEISVEVTSVYESVATMTARFAVKNWDELEDELEAPRETWFGPQGGLLTAMQSDGWEHVGSEPATFFGDGSRVVRRANTTEFLTWELPGLRQFEVVLYVRSDALGALENIVSISLSDSLPEGEDRGTDVSFLTEPGEVSSSGWQRVVLSGEDERNFTYFTIQMLDGDVSPDALQLGAVRLRSLKGGGDR